MALEHVITRWMKIISLAKLKSTGSSKELAKKVGVAVTTLHRDIHMINRLISSNLFEGVNTPIIYDKKKNTYLLKEKENELNGP